MWTDFNRYDWIAIAGSFLIIIAFLRLQQGKWTKDQRIYLYFNLFGALTILISLYFKPNPPAIWIEIFWAVISMYGLFKLTPLARYIGLLRAEQERGAQLGAVSEGQREEDLSQRGVSAGGFPARSEAGDATMHHWYDRLFSWRGRVLLRRRSVRVLNAARLAVHSAAERVDARGRMETYLGDYTKLLVPELRNIFEMLESDGLVHTADTSESAPESAPRRQEVLGASGNMYSVPYTRQMPKRTPALDDLWAAILRMAENSETEFRKMTSALGALERALEAERQMMVARTPWFVHSLVATEQAPSPPSVSEPAPNTKEFSPDEAALLARLTERFYGSSAFKIIGGALVAAALLAGGGTLYLFSHTLSLREDLDNTEDRGKKDILASAQKVQDSISAQSGTLNTAMAALDQSRKDFADRLTARKEEMDKIVQDFKTQSDSLRAEAVAQAIKVVQKELDNRVSELSKGIERTASDANDRMGKIASNITSLEQQDATIGEHARKVAQSISDDEDTVARLGPRLQQLNNYSARANDVSDTLNSIREKDEALTKAVLEGASQAKSAKEYADLADSARRSAVSTADSVRKQTTDQEHELGRLQERIENMSKALESLSGDIGKAKVSVQSDVNDLKAYLNRQKADVIPPLTKNDRDELAGQIRQLREEDLKTLRKSIDDTNVALLAIKQRAQTISDEAQAERKMVEDVTLKQANAQLQFSHLDDTFKELTQDFAAKTNDLYSSLDKIKTKVDKLDLRLQKMEPSNLCLPQSEGQLTPEHWQAIQQELNDRGFNSGEPDGKAGRNTRRAIRLFQAATHRRSDGRLTADEIKQLLPPSNVPCPSSAGNWFPWVSQARRV